MAAKQLKLMRERVEEILATEIMSNRTIAIWGASIFGLVVVWAVVDMARQQHRFAQSYRCEQNINLLSKALVQYADDWNDTLPPANHWVDCIDNAKYLPNVDRAAVFRCPASDKPYGYAMNRSVGGALLSNVMQQNLVLLYETDSGKLNASGTQESMAHVRNGSLNITYFNRIDNLAIQHVPDNLKWTLQR